MRSIVVGLGVQGEKRRRFAGSDYVACVDPVHPKADFRSAFDVPLDQFDAVFCCTPDEPKYELLSYFLQHGKHVLVEKPLWMSEIEQISELETTAQQTGTVCYTAYNHRFEPHFERMRKLITSGELGRVYSVRMFYGNGTARLVRDSAWRDQGAGVLPDLGSHLLDTCRFWLGDDLGLFELRSVNRFENLAPDHVVIANRSDRLRIELEMTLLSWRNHFTCDVYAERGSAHIESLCKWGPSTFTQRRRILPSGYPPEERITLVQEDPTWAAEYAHFQALCAAGSLTNLDSDRWLQSTLLSLAEAIPAR